ncbi:MAG: YbhB/YbcL family Raf kinase inhibitor-like protein [Candidatus Eremiobacteraeota bacterium]|nr:YbhB/YbcL family Raf kinase inhibitor-like protein [Candidatus Eremiobacteraeota bacterium]
MSISTLKFCALVALMSMGCALPASAATFALTSSAFRSGGMIPHRFSFRGYGCDGQNVSPELHWSAAPRRTRSFALTVFDPDAPGKGWWHWVLFNIPAGTTSLAQDAGTAGGERSVPSAVEGRTSFGTGGYGGPCPPPGSGSHHYIFTLYALDATVLPHAGAQTTGPQLIALAKPHTLGKAVLVGRYARSR